MLMAALKEMGLKESVETQQTACKTLIKLASNVLTKENVEKYRRIRPENPAIKSRIFDVKGGRTALRGIGFGLSECGEYYEYRGAPLAEKCIPLLEETLQILEAGGNENGGGGASNTDPSRAYVRRQGPTANDFKRFKDVSILLSLPLTPCAELTSCTLVCLAGHARPTGPLD